MLSDTPASSWEGGMLGQALGPRVASYFIERLHDVGQVYPWSTRRQHLVEEVVPEQLEEVAVPSLAPLGVTIIPGDRI